MSIPAPTVEYAVILTGDPAQDWDATRAALTDAQWDALVRRIHDDADAFHVSAHVLKVQRRYVREALTEAGVSFSEGDAQDEDDHYDF